MKTYPCCEHCVLEDGSKWCWAHEIGHGAYCLDCQSPADAIEMQR